MASEAPESTVKAFECPNCSKIFLFLSSFTLHWTNCKRIEIPEVEKEEIVITEAKKKQIETGLCEFCGTYFRQRCSLFTHLKQQHREKERRFQCHKCPRIYSTPYQLNRHLKIHETGKNYICALCNAKFIRKFSIRMHMLAKHTFDLEFSCSLCPKRFGCASQLRNHQETHSSFCKFVCQHCGMGFTQRKGLEQHKNTHSEIKRFKCVCGERFRHSSHLYMHKRKQCRYSLSDEGESSSSEESSSGQA